MLRICSRLASGSRHQWYACELASNGFQAFFGPPGTFGREDTEASTAIEFYFGGFALNLRRRPLQGEPVGSPA